VPSGEDLREGLTAVISVRLPEPAVRGADQGQAEQPEVEGIVNSVVGDFWPSTSKSIPRRPRSIVARALLAAEARESARKARPWSASARAR
jgi:DNA gyrase subunit B